MQIFMEIPFFRPQNDTNNSETVQNNEKWYERWSNFCCCCVQCLLLAVILVSDFIFLNENK